MSHNYIFLENWPWCVKKVPYVDAAEVKIMKKDLKEFKVILSVNSEHQNHYKLLDLCILFEIICFELKILDLLSQV